MVIPVVGGAQEMWEWEVSYGLGAARWNHTEGRCDDNGVAGGILVALLRSDELSHEV
jgi:hypothetical protein